MGQPRSGARPATYDDLLALPEHVVGELIDGELIVSPRPAPRHAVATSVLGGELGPPYHSGRGAQAGGGSSSSLNFILATTYWCPI